LDYFKDINEQEEVKELLVWWNQYGWSFAVALLLLRWLNFLLLFHSQIFPGYSSAQRGPAKQGAHTMIKAKRALKKQTQVQ
jgi:hypothetical protein